MGVSTLSESEGRAVAPPAQACAVLSPHAKRIADTIPRNLAGSPEQARPHLIPKPHDFLHHSIGSRVTAALSACSEVVMSPRAK